MCPRLQPGDLILHAVRGKEPDDAQAAPEHRGHRRGRWSWPCWPSRSPVTATTSRRRCMPRRCCCCSPRPRSSSRCSAAARRGTCVTAAGGRISRRRLFHAGGLGNLGSLINAQVGAAARIAVLRRSGRDEVPRVPALIAAEVPILAIEGGARGARVLTRWSARSGCRGGPRSRASPGGRAGTPAPARGHGVWAGLAALRSLEGRTRLLAFILVAVFAQVARNWLMLRTLGVDASVFDATAVLIAMVVLSRC